MKANDLIARKIAWQIIKQATYYNTRLSVVTAETFRKKGKLLSDQDRRFITMLVQGTVRLTGRLDWQLRQAYLGKYKELNESVRIILRLGAYQLFYMDNVPDYAAVSTTVQLAKSFHSKLGGLANAVLRALTKVDKYKEPDKNSPIDSVADYLSHPQWLISKWIKEYNYENTRKLAEWNNKAPALWFRVNCINYSSLKFKKYLKIRQIGFKQFKHIPDFFKTDSNQELLQSDIFLTGNISVQDPAAGLVIHLLEPKKNDIIIDACAAPGGKTAYMAELMNNCGSIIALDSNKDRIKKLYQSISRLKLTNVKTDILDITKDKVPMTKKMLLDVPCSGTGVMSKRADIRWRRSMEDILEMHLLQRKILWSASNYIKKGGVIIYSTCSIENEENWMVIDDYLKSHPDFSIDNASSYIPDEYVDKNGAMYTFPPEHQIDGGYAVRLKRDD